MSKILVVGAGGILGSELLSQLKTFQYDIESPASDELDIRNEKLVENYIGECNPDWIINCAAWTRVDAAEDYSFFARDINVIGVRNIVQTASKCRSRLIHLSTDYVFDGRANTPYSESDSPNPINQYGLTKYLGEQSILDNYAHNSYIVRTSWLYGVSGNNFVKTMVRNALNNELVNVVDDQVGSPTSSKDIASALIEMIDQTPESGIYHFTNLGECSWFQFAQEIYALVGADIALVKPISSSLVKLAASRPTYSVLSKDKWIKSGLREPPHWKQSLSLVIPDLLASEKLKELE